jgi:hypothetical protein
MMPYDFEAETQLLREVLSTAAHDLGGLSSALALRVDVLAGSLPAADDAALRAVAGEVRSLGRQLRVLRGPQGGDTLAPAGGRSLAEWYALVERFGRPLLGRGASMRGSVGDGAFSGAHASERAYALLLSVLACCRALRERRGARPVSVALRVSSVPAAVEVAMDVEWGEGLAGDDDAAVQRWLTLARETATAAGVAWDGSNGGDAIVMRAPA